MAAYPSSVSSDKLTAKLAHTMQTLAPEQHCSSLMPRPLCSTENGQSHVNAGLRAAERAIFAAERPTAVLRLP